MIEGMRGRGSRGEARVTALLVSAVLLALPLLAAAPAAPPQSVGHPAQAPGALPSVASGPAPDLDLLFTAQVAGWLEPCG